MGKAEGQHRSQLRDRFLMELEDAEPLASVRIRIEDLLRELACISSFRPIICVTHGGWIRNLLGLLGVEEIPLIRNTSVTKLRFDGTKWRILEIGATPHLT